MLAALSKNSLSPVGDLAAKAFNKAACTEANFLSKDEVTVASDSVVSDRTSDNLSEGDWVG